MKSWGQLSCCAIAASLLFLIAMTGCGKTEQQFAFDGGSTTKKDAGKRDSGGGGDDAVGVCKLTLTQINDKDVARIAKLTESDDLNPGKSGIQIKVAVLGVNISNSADVKLSVTGRGSDYIAKPVAGDVVFAEVDVDVSSTNTVVLTAASTNCLSDTVQFVVEPPPECTITVPANGATLGKKDAKNPGSGSFAYDVKISTKNAQDGYIELKVGDASQGSQKIESSAELIYTDVILSKGTVVLSATVTSKEKVTRTCTSTITVNTDLPKCIIKAFNPAAISTNLGKPGLGKAQNISTGSGFQTNITIETDTNVNSITITADGSTVKTGSASGGLATISNVPLPEGELSIQAVCLDTASGNSANSPVSKMVVDSIAPYNVANFSCKVDSARAGLINCSWTSVGDNPEGSGMELYQLRFRTDGPVTALNWDDVNTQRVADGDGHDWAAAPSGEKQDVDISKLPLGYNYYFGLKGLDYVKNANTLSATAAVALDYRTLTPPRTISTATAFGSVMATGDFNCDGFSDLAVGDKNANGGKGMVHIYQGNANGFLANPERQYSGTIANGHFGAALATIQNFDKDINGCNDLAVLAEYNNNKGKVYIYLGRKYIFSNRDDESTGSGAELIFKLPDTAAAGEKIGETLASAGDFDNDGAYDLAISHTNSESDAAEIYIVYGDATITPMAAGISPITRTLPTAPGVMISGGLLSEAFGLTLASSGAKLDNDDYADLLVGAKKTAVGGAAHGAAYVIKGGARSSSGTTETIPVTDSRVIKIEGGANNGVFGSSVAIIGKVNNALWNEFVVSDPSASSYAGEAYVFTLETTPTSVSSATVTVSNDLAGAADDKFGWGLACSALFAPGGIDFNLDGKNELIASSFATGASNGPGSIYELLVSNMSTSKAGYVFHGPTGALSYGKVLLLAKDINGDGYPDLIVGDPDNNNGQGRFFVYY